MRFEAEVFVTLKHGVLDPQGKTVQGALQALGFSGVNEVRVGKYLVVALEASDAAAAEQQVREMARRVLANPVLENFQVNVRGRTESGGDTRDHATGTAGGASA